MSFSWKDREAALQSLAQNPPELIVIGAGIAGASTAAHAARMGLKVLLLDKSDIAAGASGHSTGLAHAGLRYLAQGRIGYVFKEGRERERLQELAPQWVRPFHFVLPVYKEDPFPYWMIRLGTWIYDALGWADALLSKRTLVRRHTKLSADEVKAKIPGIRAEGLQGGIEYYVDARLQDNRFTLGYVQQAAAAGARVITHAEVSSIRNMGSGVNNVTGKDVLSGTGFQINAPLVINASGPWIDEIRGRSGLGGKRVLKSRGVHLIVDHITDSPLIMSSAVKGKVFFVIPIDSQRTLVGTTDTPLETTMDHDGPDPKEVTDLLQQLFHYFPYLKHGKHLAEATDNFKRFHVRSLYWGVRPLCFESGPTHTASREHQLVKDLPGLWSLPGVKLTAGRYAGEQAAKDAFHYLRRKEALPKVAWDSLPGGELWDFERFAKEAGKRFKLGDDSESLLRYLVSMYGTRYVEVLQWAQREESLSERLVSDEPWIFAQVAYALHEEMVLTLNDLLFRRTKWALYRDIPQERIEKIAQIMGRTLGWDESKMAAQLQEYHTTVEQHRIDFMLNS